MAEPTVDALLHEARALGLDRFDAQALASHVLQQPRAWLLAHGDVPVTAAAAAALRGLLQRRAGGEPVAYITGWRGFHGLELRVTPDVLDPRPDTETLVDWALELLSGDLAGIATPEVADLGTGSGAIALAVARACPRAVLRAVDASAGALAVARANGARLGLPVQWLQGSWWQPIAAPPLHLALANPPYLGADDPHLAALRHEPRAALVPATGQALADLRDIVAGAAPHLAPGGWLLLEHGFEQAEAVAGLLAAAGFEAIDHRLDLAGHRRCTGGRRPRG
ncbi:MAG: peptide chain release factor N(5)-glutamine methyltransferase [Betaproteobacteria bacterium]|nr:peptide chain release factor N(5)-glutamine methyltransferase [Rubrivivax sp.]